MSITGLAIVVACAVALLVIAAAIEFGRLKRPWLLSLAVVCGLALLAMLLTDWPPGVLSKFWADHSVLSALLSTILLVGVGVLAFEAHDARTQSELDESVTAAGMGGMVDHVVDVEVALALASAPDKPDETVWGDWSEEGQRPLIWLRGRRNLLDSSKTGGSPCSTDPRGVAPMERPPADTDVIWRVHLLDQGVRRIMAGLRGWAPVLGRSRNGQYALVDLGKLRIRLLEAQSDLTDGDRGEALERMRRMRRECRIIALAMERGSGALSVRDEVLQTLDAFFDPPEAKKSRVWHNLERGTWKHQREEALRQLIANTSVGCRET